MEMKKDNMDSIRFRVDWHRKHRQSTVSIQVNGTDLIDLARTVETPFARREGDPKRAGDYQGVSPIELDPPTRLLLGLEEEDFLWNDSKVAVLACAGCGETGCWPLLVRITALADTVIWQDFEQPHRRPGHHDNPWTYEGLGPFVFDRPAYEQEVARLEQEIEERKKTGNWHLPLQPDSKRGGQ